MKVEPTFRPSDGRLGGVPSWFSLVEKPETSDDARTIDRKSGVDTNDSDRQQES